MTTLTPDAAPPATETGAALDVAGLTAGYGGPPIIENVSVRAHRGAITAVVGPNGAGKSTLLKAIAGVIRAKAGSVRVEGNDVTGLSTEKLVRRGIAYVPQVANVFPQLSVQENLEMGGYIRRHGLRERIEQVRATNVAVVVVEQNTRETLRHARWAYVLVLGQNRLDGPGRDLLHNDEVVRLYVGVLSAGG